MTGNPNKLREWQRIIPAGSLELQSVDIDLPEIQSLDLREIITDKAHRAYGVVGGPVFVEDISAGLDELNGLPGPFIKYFEDRLGKGALHKLASSDKSPATVTATMAYYDGDVLLIALKELHGNVVPPRDGEGWGFDFCFIPDGSTKTFSQMGPAAKDKISHRSLAMRDLIDQVTVLP